MFLKLFNNPVVVIPCNIIAGICNKTCQYHETIFWHKCTQHVCCLLFHHPSTYSNMMHRMLITHEKHLRCNVWFILQIIKKDIAFFIAYKCIKYLRHHTIMWIPYLWWVHLREPAWNHHNMLLVLFRVISVWY